MTLEEKNRLALKKFIEYRQEKQVDKEEGTGTSIEKEEVFHYKPSYTKNKLVEIDLGTLYDNV
jgi:hypothetical protein